MKRIGLIACSKHKLGESEPERKFKASEIYTGHTFRIARDIGLKRFNCDDWNILSAKYNLLDTSYTFSARTLTDIIPMQHNAATNKKIRFIMYLFLMLIRDSVILDS